MVQEVCKTAEECTPAVNWITYLITALVGVKMLIILFLNLQGYFWWRNVLASYFTLSIKILLILSSGVVSIKNTFDQCRLLRSLHIDSLKNFYYQ